MKEIKLGRSGLVALVDDDDYEKLKDMPWSVRRHKYVNYAGSCSYVDGKYQEISMHRMIMGFPQGMMIDHKDHNGLNNQKSNLRVCTRNQNRQHKKIIQGAVPYLGVSIRRLAWNNKPYKADIMHDKVAVFLGFYSTAEEAAIEYNKAAMRLHGEFASLNIIPDYTDEKGIPLK